MGQTLDSRAHAAALLRTLADAAEDPAISEERLAALAQMIGQHLMENAPRAQVRREAAVLRLCVRDTP